MLKHNPGSTGAKKQISFVVIMCVVSMTKTPYSRPILSGFPLRQEEISPLAMSFEPVAI